MRLVLVAVIALAAGCADDGPGDVSFVAANGSGDAHPHELTIDCADLEAAGVRSYTTTGGSDHEHAIELTVEQLEALSIGTTINLGLTDGHPHSFAIAVPSGACR